MAHRNFHSTSQSGVFRPIGEQPIMAGWLKVVVATFSAEERKKLAKMLPGDRAKALIARRDELVRAGKLKLDDKPAAAPTKEP